jgi:hypothetical protein
MPLAAAAALQAAQKAADTAMKAAEQGHQSRGQAPAAPACLSPPKTGA